MYGVSIIIIKGLRNVERGKSRTSHFHSEANKIGALANKKAEIWTTSKTYKILTLSGASYAIPDYSDQ